MEHLIKARAMLQQLSAILVKYRAHVVDIREIYVASMEQHRFPYSNTCKDLFIKWSEYEKSHPLKWYLEMTLRQTDRREHHVANFILLICTLSIIFSEFYVINRSIDRLVKGRWLLQETLIFCFVKNYFGVTFNWEVLLDQRQSYFHQMHVIRRGEELFPISFHEWCCNE